MDKIDRDRFLFACQQLGTLTPIRSTWLERLLSALEADDKITDIRHAAYMLATTYHETARTWQPIAEYGKGKGRDYGVQDKITGQTYYGRGYVQLTWLDNYRAFGVILKKDLVNNPDLALLPDVAYQIMSYGMRKGAFTGVGLSKYIHDDVCDYLHARKIINGMDCAEKIAGYAALFEKMLQDSILAAA